MAVQDCDAVRLFIALGANRHQPKRQLAAARRALAALPLTQLVRSSSLYRTAPLGDCEQADYINAVVELSSQLGPGVMLGALHGIEQAFGRVRSARRFGPRVLDLDLLAYGTQVIETPTLTVPHPRLHQRRFVLQPLLEIAPQLNLPPLGGLDVYLANCASQPCERLTDDAGVW